MAEPLSIAALLGLAFLAKKLSETTPELPQEQPKKTVSKLNPLNDPTLVPPEAILSFSDLLKRSNKERYVAPAQGNFGDISPNTNFALGMPDPSQNFKDRMFVSNQQNNISPTDKILVGPGLGVGPDVPAVGGFQQVYRVLPNNVGGYKLNQLPGRPGPRDGTALTGGVAPEWGSASGGVWGNVAHNRPEKTAYIPVRHPVMRSRAQGQGDTVSGPTEHESYEKTKRQTNRAETTQRTDGLNYAPAKRFVPAGELNQDPTRNKTDFNEAQFNHVDNPQPGITNFVGAYTTTANNIRDDDKRSKLNRPGPAGPAGRQNLFMNTPGKITQVRHPTCPQPIMARGPTASAGQQYVPLGYQEDNKFKGNHNPYAGNRSLNIAHEQLKNNPLAHSISD